jgi:glycosyltransferase involved in cell wall biosynthesis
MLYRDFRVSLLIPCYNESETIEQVIDSFRDAIPSIEVYVFDNNSTDITANLARASGAHVVAVPLRGKGNVVRRMFADIEADIFVLVDGDATYDAPSVRRLVDKLLEEQLDMVVGCRATPDQKSSTAYRRGHQFGNWLITRSMSHIFGGTFKDVLSGYRVFSRRFVKSFPALSAGFEIEIELTVHALVLRMPYGELMTPYRARPEGSISKLSTYRDGLCIIGAAARLYIAEQPFTFYAICATCIALLSITMAVPILDEYLKTGSVPRLPTAVLSASMMICAALSFVCGIVIENITRCRHEIKRLIYLSIPHPFHNKGRP